MILSSIQTVINTLRLNIKAYKKIEYFLMHIKIPIKYDKYYKCYKKNKERLQSKACEMC